MPVLSEEIQHTLWTLADSLVKALQAPQDGGQADMNWGVSGRSSNVWDVTHPDLPMVKDDEGWTKDTLLQLQVKELPDGKYAVVAVNKVLGTETNSFPLVFIVAKQDTPPGPKWPIAEIAKAAANWFRVQLAELKKKAEGMQPGTPPGAIGGGAPAQDAGMGGMGFPGGGMMASASRRLQIALKVARGI